MFIVKILLLAFMLVSSVFIIIVVMRQKGDSDGISALSGGSSSETFYGKNKAKNKDALLKKLTYIAFGLLAFCSIVYFVFSALGL